MLSHDFIENLNLTGDMNAIKFLNNPKLNF
ncbi:Uncharacterised protein [Providencia alcalifaciens]|nr:Uncharacterised protein [Providencia alcalifaciens]